MTEKPSISRGYKIYLQATILSLMTSVIYTLGLRVMFTKNPSLDTISLFVYIGLFGYWIILGLEEAIDYLKQND